MQPTTLIPTLYLENLEKAIEFYKKAFAAEERWVVKNSNGKIHVGEILIGRLFIRLHEENIEKKQRGPANAKSISVILNLLTPDPDALAARAVQAGATLIDPLQTFEYGYRQGIIQDPFGYQWGIEGLEALSHKPFEIPSPVVNN